MINRFKKTFIALPIAIAAISAGSYAYLHGESSEWYGLYSIVRGAMDTNAVIDTILQTMSNVDMPEDQIFDIQNGMSVKLTAGTNGYAHLLEVWKNDVKGIEFSYDDETRGELIIQPNLFDPVTYPANHLVKCVYDHRDAAVGRHETMQIEWAPGYVQPYAPTKSVVDLVEKDGMITLRMTSIMETDIGSVWGIGAPSNDTAVADAYMLVAKIQSDAPNKAVAKEGLVDSTSTASLTLFGNDFTDNAGLFNSTSGWVADGIDDTEAAATYPDYPLPSSVDLDPLPIADAHAVNVEFALP